MRIAIDLRSSCDFWTFSPRHRASLSQRIPAVRLDESTAPGQVVTLLSEADAYFGWRFEPDWFLVSPRLRWIASPAAGVDHLPLEAAAAHGVMVSRSFGFHGVPMAEHVMGFVLGFARGLFLGMARQRTDLWWKADVAAEFFDVAGSTMTIVGCGTVGREVARLAAACGIRVLGVRRRLPPAEADVPAVSQWFGPADAEQALGQSQIVVNVLPATAETAGFFGARQFAVLPPGAVFINVGRGSTVDEAALLSALESGQVAWCGLDVTARKPPPADDPLRFHPRVVLTPKTSVFSHRYMDQAVEFFAGNLERYLNGLPLLGVVTTPVDAGAFSSAAEGVHLA
jgi:phosphoglycerate dehydrogenase-like enzyme